MGRLKPVPTNELYNFLGGYVFSGGDETHCYKLFFQKEEKAHGVGE